MHGRDIIVIGGSAGAYENVARIVSLLPANCLASLFVVLHTPLPSLPAFGATLTTVGELPVHTAVDGEPIQPGHIYLAPGQHNMLLERGRVRVVASPREHAFHPSINALFRTAALIYGPRVVGIILSGLLNDGTAGLWQIKQRGGITIVQSPTEARFAPMPESALRNVAVDYCVSAREMAALLLRVTSEPLAPLPARGAHPVKVLIVEDEAVVALNLQKGLLARGYDVSAIMSSAEAAMAAVLFDPPDIVLMDIVLPGALDGTQAAGMIWEQCHVPVVYITAHDDAATLDKVKASEPYGYVLKPFEMGQVHAAIQLALDWRDKEVSPA